MKQILTLLIFFSISFAGSTQQDWRQLPPNNGLLSEMPESYDMAVGTNGTWYLIYPVMNQMSDHYDLYFDSYTVADGWNTIEVYPTTNDTDIEIKVAQLDTEIYVMANTNNGNRLTIFEISGDNIFELDEENFPTFSNTQSWGFYPGVYQGEVYFLYDNTKFYRFNYFSQTWTNLGNPFSGSGPGVTPSATQVYVDNDSVFVAGRYTSGGVSRIRLRAASKWNWSWGAYSNGDVYALNGGVVDTITGNNAFFLFGDQQHSMQFIARDNGTPKLFSAGNGSYSEGTVFPLEYDDESSVVSTGTGAWIMAESSNLSDPNVVYNGDFGNTSWNQMTVSPFAASTVSPDNKRMKVHPASDRAMIGYRDNVTSEYIVKTTNNVPVVTFPGTASATICANTTADLLSALQIEDQDDDDILFVSVESSNTAVIDPSAVIVNILNSTTNVSTVDANALIGDVAATETVTLIFHFTDGFDVLDHTVTFTVQPNEQDLLVEDELGLCSNGDAIDLYDYISVSGGSFSTEEGPFSGHYYDPSAMTEGEVIYYTLSGNGCVASDTLHIDLFEAPVAVITATASSNCTQNDGSAVLAITGGTTPYEFLWNTGNTSDLMLTGLPAGSIHADIVDGAGCQTMADAIIENGGSTITAVTTDISCFGAADGGIDLTISGMIPPLTVLWSNGYSSQDIDHLQPGNHQVWITDDNGCTATASFNIASPDRLELELVAMNADCGVSNGSAEVENLTGGTEPYVYSWSNSGTSEEIDGIPSGIYSLTVTDANGCSVSESIGISDNGAPYADSVGITDAHCNGHDGAIAVQLHEIGEDASFTWSNGAEDTSAISGLDPGMYSLHGTNAEGCNSYTVMNVNLLAPERQQICVVTVDSATTTNLVVWEKNGDPTVSYFNMYRETMVPGQYQWIDSVHADSISLFNDVIASPSEKAWKYRISAVDECGTESVLSTAHKTIHLVMTDLGNGDFQVNWNFYQGTNAPGYNFYRYTATNGWQLITTTPASLNYFTDSPATTDELDYMVEFDLDATCTADMLKSQDFNTTRSNKERGQFDAGDGTGGPNNGLTETPIGSGSVTLFPNPAMNELVFVKVKGLQELDYVLETLTGERAGSGTLKEGVSVIGLENLHSGMYILHLLSDKSTAILRFVVN